MSYVIVNEFEKTIAEYAGSKYAVAVSSCCNAIFLCLKYLQSKNFFFDCNSYYGTSIPKHTYPGVACSIINAGLSVQFDNRKWDGIYELNKTGIYDSALRFKKGMYIKNSFYCLSFHAKKHIPIGRGGMILTDNKEAYEWFKKARFDGRGEMPLKDDPLEIVGWNVYMTPEQAARGLTLFSFIKDKDLPDLNVAEQNYPDLSKVRAYQ